MKLWLRRTMCLWGLLLTGCGATYHSEPTREPRMTRHGNSYFEQGNIYLKKQRYHEAIEQYQQALRLNPDVRNYPRCPRLGVLQRRECWMQRLPKARRSCA